MIRRPPAVVPSRKQQIISLLLPVTVSEAKAPFLKNKKGASPVTIAGGGSMAAESSGAFVSAAAMGSMIRHTTTDSCTEKARNQN